MWVILEARRSLLCTGAFDHMPPIGGGAVLSGNRGGWGLGRAWLLAAPLPFAVPQPLISASSLSLESSLAGDAWEGGKQNR